MEIINIDRILSKETLMNLNNEIAEYVGYAAFKVSYGKIFIGEINKTQTNNASFKIITIICAYYGIHYTELTSGIREEPIVTYRQIAHYLLRKYTGLDLKAIAKTTNLKNHATVINSIKQIGKKLTDPMFVNEIDDIEQQIIKIIE